MSGEVAERQVEVSNNAPWPSLAFSEAVAINPKRTLPKSGDVPFLDMAALPLHGAPVEVMEKRPVASGGARFQAGDTLFARITPCAENGKLGFVSQVAGGTTAQGSTEFVVMGARDGLTLPEYVRWLSGWSFVRDHAIGLMEGTSGRQRIPAWAFDEIEVPVPPLDEQRRIAEVLRSVDEAIAANGDAIEQLRLTRDAIRDEHFRASGLNIHARTLGSICEITKLAGFEYSKYIQYGESDEIIAIRGLNIKDGDLFLDDIKTISRATSQALPRSALRTDDLVMSYVGTIGEVAKVDADDRYHLAPNVALLRCGAQALPDYILHFLYSCAGRAQISKHVSTSSQQSLSMSKIRSFEIALPSEGDQRHITATIGSLNASLKHGLQTQSQLLAQKAHLLNDLLSGRVRVPA